MLEARKLKSEDELALLDHAAAIVDAVYEEIYRTLRPGITENQVVAQAMKTLFDLGSEHVEAINAISGDRCNPHPHTFADRLLRPGDQAFFDIIHAFNGYRTCYYRTFNVGYATPSQLDAYRRCREWLDAAIDLVRPGVTTDKIAEVWPTAKEIGLPDEHAAFGLQFGHGIGVGLYESPMISRLHSLDAPVELEVGMVFALETYCPATDGRSAARIEEEVVVTPTGPRVLTRFPAEELLVTGRTYVRGIDLLDGRVVREVDPSPAGNRARPRRPETGSRQRVEAERLRRVSGSGVRRPAGVERGGLQEARATPGRSTERALPPDAPDPALRGARPVALPARRGVRHDPPLLGPGGGVGRASRARSRTATASPARTAATGTCWRAGAGRRRCSPSWSGARPA